MADQPALSPGRQHDALAGLVDGCPCRRDPLLGQGQLVKRAGPLARRILYGEAGDTCLHAQPHVLGEIAGLMGIARLEVGIHRHVDSLNDLTDMRQHQITRNGPVGIREALREGDAGTRRGQRLEAEALQEAGGAHIPRIRHDEGAAGLVQPAEDVTAVVDGAHCSLLQEGRAG